MSTQATEHVAHFTVDGEWLSNFCRTRVMEGAWEHALKILTQDVNCTHEQAIKILRGHATLIGDSGSEDGIGWKDLSSKGKIAKGMDEQLDYLYGMVFKYGDRYWKPYAVVQGWDADDMDFVHKYGGSVNTLGDPGKRPTGRTRYELRSLFYANTPNKDLLVFIGEDKFSQVSDVLCEETPIPPLWFEVPVNRPIEHLRALLKAGKLHVQTRGAHQDKAPAVPKSVTIAERADAFLAELNATTSVNEVNATLNKHIDIMSHHDVDEDTRRVLREQQMTDEIRKHADEMGGWYELNLRTDELPNFEPATLKVPKNPFLLWALRGFRFEDFGKERPEWNNVAHSGYKMQMDDPNHTDWMLGAGINLDDSYKHDYDYKKRGEDQTITLGEAAMRAAYNVKHDIVKAWTGVNFTILAKGEESYVGGVVVHPKPGEIVEPGCTAIVPHAGPAYQLTMMQACKKGKDGRPGVLICETGGQLAHLAIVGREMKCTVIMVPKALTKYHEGELLSIDLDEKKITLNLL